MVKQKPTSRSLFQQRFGKPIEEYDSIKRAVEPVKDVTRQNYYRVLPSYFLFINENPDQVIEQRRKDIGDKNYEQAENYERKTMAFAKTLLSKGQSGRGVQGIIGRMQGFFANNSRRYSLDMRRLNLPKARKVQKYSPTNEELRHLYTIADNSRDRLIVAVMYHNGLAPVDVSCLSVGDLPQEEWTYYEKSRSKTGEIFRSVVTPDIAYELQIYMQNRTKLIEQHVKELVIEFNRKPKEHRTEEDLQEIEKWRGFLAKGQPLFIGRQGALDNQAISGIISELIEKSGLDDNNGFKPTSLRDALEDALVDANVNHKIKEALMGHVSDIEHEYGGQNKLVINIVEGMKKTYPLLTLNGLTRISTDQHVSKQEFEAMKKQLADFKEEMGDLKEFRDRLVEIENQLYLDRKLFEEELGLEEETPHTKKREQHEKQTKKENPEEGKT